MKPPTAPEQALNGRKEERLRFSHLMASGKIGCLELRNRIIMPPMGTNYADANGFVSERLTRYYQCRAEGGAGLIIVEVAAVAPEGRAISNQVGIWADKFIPGLRHLASAVKEYGARVAIQLHHAGRQTTSRICGSQPVAPSGLPCPVCQETPRELSTGEIKGLVRAFGHAARRAREAGFDALEIHGTHGYLINQFLSPLSNRRTDEYGGNREGRIRFAMEILQSVRSALGEDFPLIWRLNAGEYLDGGLSQEEGLDIALLLARSGNVDALHVSAGAYGSPAPMIATMSEPQLPLVEHAARVKELVELPVIAVGKIHDPEQGEQVLAAGKADFVAVGRGLITDSHFARKVELGQVENIRKCIQCNQLCIDPLLIEGRPVSCIYNARAGKEVDFPLVKARRARKVVVVGGGPAGLEAARVARERGHRVVLFEQSAELGGQNLIARAVPFKDRFGEILRYLAYRVKRLDVELRMATAASEESVLNERPDSVILATGARPLIPELPGLDPLRAVTAWDLLQGKVKAGRRVAIIGGGLTGCETAEFLAEKGHQVIILEKLDEPALNQSFSLRSDLLKRLKRSKAVEIRTRTEAVSLGERSVIARQEGVEVTIEELDTIVIAAGSQPYNPLEASLKMQMDDVYAVGDCDRPGNAAQAIHEAYQVAYRIQ